MKTVYCRFRCYLTLKKIFVIFIILYANSSLANSSFVEQDDLEQLEFIESIVNQYKSNKKKHMKYIEAKKFSPESDKNIKNLTDINVDEIKLVGSTAFGENRIAVVKDINNNYYKVKVGDVFSNNMLKVTKLNEKYIKLSSLIEKEKNIDSDFLHDKDYIISLQ